LRPQIPANLARPMTKRQKPIAYFPAYRSVFVRETIARKIAPTNDSAGNSSSASRCGENRTHEEAATVTDEKL
jgi:hypothetical protein